LFIHSLSLLRSPRRCPFLSNRFLIHTRVLIFMSNIFTLLKNERDKLRSRSLARLFLNVVIFLGIPQCFFVFFGIRSPRRCPVSSNRFLIHTRVLILCCIFWYSSQLNLIFFCCQPRRCPVSSSPVRTPSCSTPLGIRHTLAISELIMRAG